MKVCIIGSGSWGTALAIKSVVAGNDTTLYCRRSEFKDELIKYRENKSYLAGVTLPEELIISSDLKSSVKQADMILIVTPSIHVRTALQNLKEYAHKDQIYVLCSKGVERESGKLLTTVMKEELYSIGCHLTVLSGPNHAEEIGRNLPAAAVVGTTSMEIGKKVQQALHSKEFRIYTSDDYVGVELAGATKNVIALAAGIVDGLSLGDNCKALLLTRGLHEMTRFGLALGARKETYAGLAGMGDLIATCMSLYSRNRAAGQQLAAGKTMDYIMNHTNMVVEGFFATSIIRDMAIKHHVEMPITQSLYEVLYEEKSPQLALQELMGRGSKNEVS
ncbi:NAD(P)H-dependent glycerol-3-phosphate dehydrogenase [uncultured Veillonella sp.]|uniref:NAD(P)H-dependent glycerol-3-phosphate dehydrogenase n=1 Tax=uncultured Veillonella sp. TaxID=159268 RepID=UPI0025E8E5BD|nr:NAD(P)H-dependent glycerol-3-phosphate dehydrogenase [uncultured Veillonella sp.]